MIINKSGRTYSLRTDEEELKLLQKELDVLDPDERETLQVMLEEMRSGQDGQDTLAHKIGKLEYKQTPVDMKTFVMDPYYLGHTCGNLYPKLLADLTELFEGGYHECVWTGAIGTGKTFSASIGVCRVLYELSCLVDPHRSYGLAKDSNISIVALSVSEMLATKVVFENIAVKIDASPYFRENFPFEKTKKEMRFPGNLWIASRASTDTSALGLNTISAFIDESNFMPKAKAGSDPRFAGVDRAEVIYNAIKRRMKSRFEKFGRLPGMLFLVSSKSTQDDFTARRVLESKNDPSMFVRDYAGWDVKPEAYFNSKRFDVLGGNEQTPSRILNVGEKDVLEKTLPDGCVIVSVPEDFRVDFERDLEGSLRDIAGISTVAISPFIQRREKIVDAIEQGTKIGLHHPFSVQIYDASRGGSFVWSEMVQMTKTRAYGQRIEKMMPIINPTAPRHIHVDPALRKDALGICMAHVSGWKDVVRREKDSRQQFMERAPIYTVDFMLRVVPPTGDEIILGDIRRMVYDLTAHGYLVTSVSMDSFNSADSLQQLAQKGYNAQLISVDVTPDPYDSLKDALYEDRLVLYDYPPLVEELRVLEQRFDARKKRKIDHPPRGCFVGSTRIPLADGSVVTIDALAGEEVWVYAMSAADVIVPACARGRRTKETVELVDVILDTGAVERCTPEHLWRLNDGSYREARRLSPDVVLAPWYGLRVGVKAVIPVHLDVAVPVYDLEVDDHANFALASGVFVHNSKDVADALAGCLWSLQKNAPHATPLSPIRGMSKYGGNDDPWMEEQRQAVAAGNRNAGNNQDLRDYGMLPPMLGGSDGSDDPFGGQGGEGGGGWNGGGTLF